MPTYEYECSGCGHRLEKFQAITAKPLRKCPRCGKSRLQRLVGGGGGLIFKGSGFYQTDYRSESYQQAAKSEADRDKVAADGGKAAAGTGGGSSDASGGASGAQKAAQPVKQGE